MSKEVVIVGAGITGLSAAWALHTSRPDVRVRVLERRDRPGGNIITERVGGFLLDGGPASNVCAVIPLRPDRRVQRQASTRAGSFCELPGVSSCRYSADQSLNCDPRS